MLDTSYIKKSSFLASLELFGRRAMRRGTPEERRWKNGLRQSARTRDTSTPVRCRTGPVAETKRSSGKVAATAALQAYLFHDKDARSRIPRFAMGRADVVPEMHLMVKSKEREILAKNQEPGDVESKNSATAHTTATSGAESPLSRFQKHVKQAPFQPDQRELPGRKHCGGFTQPRDSIAAVSGQSLARSLMDKIQEAKDLRHPEESSKHQMHCHRDLGDRRHSSSPSGVTEYCTEAVCKTTFHTFPSSVTLSSPSQSSALTGLKNSPPVPHTKPVIPAISTFPPSSQPSPKRPTVEYQHSEQETVVTTPKEPVSIISGVIKAANAALLIQRGWRRKLSHRREPGIPELNRNEVTLIIDKHVESVGPMLSEVKSTHQTNDALNASADDVAAISAVKINQVAGICSSMKATGASLPSYGPWTDHDLVFLEEGHCFEFQESVRTTMDQGELVWKRPQLVIQQLETRRMSTIQKTHGQQRKPQQQVETPCTTETMESMESIERRNELCAKTASNIPLTEKKLRRDLKCPRVRIIKHRSGKGKATLSAGRAPPERRKMFTRVDQARTNFCRFSNSTNKPQDGDRNHSNQADNDIANDQSDENSQVLKTDSAALDHFVVFSEPTETMDANGSESLRNDLICVGDLALARSLLYENGNPLSSDNVDHYNDVIPLTQSPSNSLVNEHPDGQVPIEGQLVWQSERYPQVDVSVSEDLARGYSASLDSTDSNASTDSCTAEDAAQPLSQSTTDPMIALNVMESAVTNTIARIQDECSPQPACNQLLEAAPIIPVAQLRLDEDKRLEFLRALNDFKRCLRPSSCASSTMTLHGSSSLRRAVETEVLTSALNIQSETVDVALGSYDNSDSDL